MGGLCCKTHLPAPKADNNCIGELLAELQATSSSCLQGPVPEKLLELIDCVLNALQSSVASVGRVESTLGGALDAVRPHVEAFAAFATAVKQVLDVSSSLRPVHRLPQSAQVQVFNRTPMDSIKQQLL